MIDADGVEIMLLVPRFGCRGRGPWGGAGRTFSVLPAAVVPRRKWSLELALKAAWWAQGSLRAGLDYLGTLKIFVDACYLRRWLAVLGVGCERLRQHPLARVHVEVAGSRRNQAGEFVRACRAWEASGNGPPETLILAWQQRWQMRLLAVRV